MSISSAPSSTASRTSASLTSIGDCPEGNDVATDATFTVEPASFALATATRFGYTQTAATAGMLLSAGSGRIAFAHNAATLPGVSAPSSVVRSIIRIARSSAASFDPFLIDRFARSAARASSATASTAPTRGSRRSSGSSRSRGRSWACAIRNEV